MTQDIEPSPDRPFRILVIEDDAEVARLMCLALKKDGLECHSATDGILGLQLFDQRQPHLVLLDWMMPNMNGREVLDALRAHSNVPVIVVSALADASATDFQGADAHIGKPFNPTRLLRRVRDLLSERYGA